MCVLTLQIRSIGCDMQGSPHAAALTQWLARKAAKSYHEPANPIPDNRLDPVLKLARVSVHGHH